MEFVYILGVNLVYDYPKFQDGLELDIIWVSILVWMRLKASKGAGQGEESKSLLGILFISFGYASTWARFQGWISGP
jgi:hypothetical protein